MLRAPGLAKAVLEKYGKQSGGDGHSESSPDDEQEDYTPKHAAMNQLMKCIKEGDVRKAVKAHEMLMGHYGGGDSDGDDDYSDDE